MVVHKIEAKKPPITSPQTPERLIKVAAYCRVSTEQDEQANSYEAQIEHYTNEIGKHKNWLNAGIFADKGITGTSAQKRPDFIKMIKKCRQGKIDLILVKSISRFARNTVECLEFIRELKSLGIGVIFEKENINTLTETSEAMITIMGYFAQAESESISKNVSWGIRHNFAEGKVKFACDIYGYKRVFAYDENGKRKSDEDRIEVVEEEAKVIREIFERYYSGESQKTICDYLNEKGIPAPNGNTKWCRATVIRILRNEKYKGDVITQKTFCIDLMNHKRVKNTGQLPQHYITDHHEAIVDRDLFDKVQTEYARRNAIKRATPNIDEGPKKSKYSSKYALTEILVCGHCGSPYKRYTWSHHGKKDIVWRCTTRVEYGASKCSKSPNIHEHILHSAILKALSELSDQKEYLKDDIKTALAETMLDDGTDISIAALEQQLKAHENEMMRLVRICAERGNQEEFESEFKRINTNIADLRKIIEVEKTKMRPALDIDSRLEALFEKIDTATASIETFDNGIIRQLIAQIKVESENELTIILHNGYKLKAIM